MACFSTENTDTLFSLNRCILACVERYTWLLLCIVKFHWYWVRIAISTWVKLLTLWLKSGLLESEFCFSIEREVMSDFWTLCWHHGITNRDGLREEYIFPDVWFESFHKLEKSVGISYNSITKLQPKMPKCITIQLHTIFLYQRCKLQLQTPFTIHILKFIIHLQEKIIQL